MNTMVTTRAIFLLGILCAAGASGLVAACYDLTPTTVPAEVDVDSGDQPPIDAGSGDAQVDVDTRPACQVCVESPDNPGPGCGDELAKCKADEKCGLTYDCLLVKKCLTKASQQAMIICGLPCAAEAGIVTTDEPSALLVLDVVTCAQASCVGPCHIGDAGGGG